MKNKKFFAGDYLFFGHFYRICSDDKKLCETIVNIYRHLRSVKMNSNSQEIFIGWNNKKGKEAVVILEGSRHILHRVSLKEIALSIPTLISSRLTTHYIFHGGVVSYKNRGIIICAYSAFGKTTLIMELMRRGFPLLSDELVPISRSNRMIEPFPRSLHLSGNTLKLFPEIGVRQHRGNTGESFERKEMIDIEELPWEKTGKKCLPKYVVFLSPPGGIKGKDSFLELAVGFTKEGFIRDLKKLPGVEKIYKIGGRDFSLLRLKINGEVKLMTALKELCDCWQIPMIYAHRGKAEAVNWKASPHLKPITSSQGVLKLAQMLLLTSKSVILKEKLSGSNGRLLAEISRLAKDISFFEMVPGRIMQMGEVIEKMVRKVN